MDNLATALKSIDLNNKEQKQAFELIQQFDDEIRKLRLMFEDPLSFLHDKICEYRNRVDLAREGFKLDEEKSKSNRTKRIDERAQSLNHLINEYDLEQKEFVESGEFRKRFGSVEAKLKLCESQRDKWANELSQLKNAKNRVGIAIDCSRLEDIETLRSLIKEIEKSFQSQHCLSLIQLIEDFEKHGINPLPPAQPSQAPIEPDIIGYPISFFSALDSYDYFAPRHVDGSDEEEQHENHFGGHQDYQDDEDDDEDDNEGDYHDNEYNNDENDDDQDEADNDYDNDDEDDGEDEDYNEAYGPYGNAVNEINQTSHEEDNEDNLIAYSGLLYTTTEQYEQQPQEQQEQQQQPYVVEYDDDRQSEDFGDFIDSQEYYNNCDYEESPGGYDDVYDVDTFDGNDYYNDAVYDYGDNDYYDEY